MSLIDFLPLVIIDRIAAADADAWLRFAGRLHPLFVHFPLAFVVLAALVELMHLLRGREGVAPGVRLLLVAATLGALAAGGSGWMNASFEWADLDATWRAEGRPDGPRAADAEHLQWHRVTSIGVAAGLLLVTAGAVAVGTTGTGGIRTLTRLGLAAVLAGSLVTGHLGGELVHGRGYVLAAFPEPAAAADPPAAGGEAPVAPAAPEAPVARQSPVVEPITGDPAAALLTLETQALEILDNHCAECHGPSSQKAGLQLLPLDRAFEWEPEFWTIVPGDADESLVVQRIELPEGHRRRMPPDGPGLSDQERTTLRAWITAGATVGGLAPGGG